ncbi:protein kinase [Notoacmeibacter sp. MSK16QG-6]|uniref:protein kinase domain-containing protein n=1 Tax=Notoacmeibacter sp. MSK16QG-6 TaxID=2957982 RepID=UPI0020A18309|nr:protein kinase [Notoacmeibacter sp. MSK16QG-6]
MARDLAISIGQYSEAGLKPANQDFYGAIIPAQPALALKGIAVAIADGISSSPVSHIAAQSAIKSFLSDYYCTSDSWTVKTAASRVIAAANSWLYGETRRTHVADRDHGHVTTFSALVLKARTAHLFHIGDSRIFRLAGEVLERLTEDHRIRFSAEEDYLGRALGMAGHVEIDYRTVPLSEGDVYVLTTDGVHEHVSDADMARLIHSGGNDLDAAARTIASRALEQGSSDNLTIQIVRIETLPEAGIAELLYDGDLAPPQLIPEAGEIFDGWRLVRRIYASARSHLFEAVDVETGAQVALKIPALDMSQDKGHLRRMLMEEWVARRLANPHLLNAHTQGRPRKYLYTTMELLKARTLTRWMADNPAPDLASVRAIVVQIANGLQAMHRRQMIHQDLRPENVMIDETGHVTLIDFGATRVAGVDEAGAAPGDEAMLGTMQYAAPEYFLGEGGTATSDVYSLGVITYQMLTGRLPYGAEMARTRTRAQQKRVSYQPASGDDSAIPRWIDAALRRATHFDPHRRYEEPAEFIADLSTPNPALPGVAARSFMERDPVRFWRIVSLLLALLCFGLLIERAMP